MRRTARATPRFFTGLAFASALCLPAAALAAQFDYFIKLPPIEGDSGKGGEIEIHSFSWGATQTSHGGGHGTGKVNVHDISISRWPAGAAASGEKGGTEDINIGVGELQGTAGKEMVLKGSKIGENAPAARLPGKRTPPTGTLKRGTSSAAAGGVQVAAGDIDGDGSAGVVQYYNPKELTIDKPVPRQAVSGLATGKRMHKPRMVPAPLAAGSLTVTGKFPACMVGARYSTLELGDRAARYTLQDVVVTRCGGSSGEALPMEEVSFNYAKIKT